MTAKLDIKDWARGTTPPITLNMSRSGESYSLVGCTIAFVVRSAKWENSTSDSTALIRRKISFYEVPDLASLPVLVPVPASGDLAWITSLEIVRRYDGGLGRGEHRGKPHHRRAVHDTSQQVRDDVARRKLFPFH